MVLCVKYLDIVFGVKEHRYAPLVSEQWLCEYISENLKIKCTPG